MVIGGLVAGVPMPLEAVTVKVTAPFVVGVPERTPLVGSRLSPGGRAPLVTVYVDGGVPVAAKV
jgi:hypothetical protein